MKTTRVSHAAPPALPVKLDRRGASGHPCASAASSVAHAPEAIGPASCAQSCLACTRSTSFASPPAAQCLHASGNAYSGVERSPKTPPRPPTCQTVCVTPPTPPRASPPPRTPCVCHPRGRATPFLPAMTRGTAVRQSPRRHRQPRQSSLAGGSGHATTSHPRSPRLVGGGAAQPLTETLEHLPGAGRGYPAWIVWRKRGKKKQRRRRRQRQWQRQCRRCQYPRWWRWRQRLQLSRWLSLSLSLSRLLSLWIGRAAPVGCPVPPAAVSVAAAPPVPLEPSLHLHQQRVEQVVGLAAASPGGPVGQAVGGGLPGGLAACCVQVGHGHVHVGDPWRRRPLEHTHCGVLARPSSSSRLLRPPFSNRLRFHLRWEWL